MTSLESARNARYVNSIYRFYSIKHIHRIHKAREADLLRRLSLAMPYFTTPTHLGIGGKYELDMIDAGLMGRDMILDEMAVQDFVTQRFDGFDRIVLRNGKHYDGRRIMVYEWYNDVRKVRQFVHFPYAVRTRPNVKVIHPFGEVEILRPTPGDIFMGLRTLAMTPYHRPYCIDVIRQEKRTLYITIKLIEK